MPDLFDFVLTTDPRPEALADVFAADRLHRSVGFEEPVDAAAAGGFVSDRLGYAFLAGYQAALRALLPDLPNVRVALCATETGGGHPAVIRTTLTPAEDGYVLAGTKSFVTLGRAAQLLVVLASAGRDGSGRNALRAVLLPADLPGISLAPQPELPFAPEIPHSTLALATVSVPTDAVLPDDGYSRYLKPFRTVEDLHVQAAALGWLIGVARRSTWPAPWLERALAALAGVRHLARADPTSPGTHLTLAGLRSDMERLVNDADSLWERADAVTRERWMRDRPLLDVADRVRTARTAAAWQRVNQHRRVPDRAKRRTPVEPEPDSGSTGEPAR